MEEKTILRIFAVFLLGLSVCFIVAYSNWQTALGVFLLLWAENVSKLAQTVKL